MKDAHNCEPDTAGLIAIVGLAGRVPGVDSIDAFWKAICDGRDLIRRHDPDALADNFTDAERGARHIRSRASIAGRCGNVRRPLL